MVVVIGEWAALIDCACVVVSEETRREETDGRSQEEVGVYSCNIIKLYEHHQRTIPDDVG